MSSELAGFLQNSFVDSLAEAESEISGSVLFSYFTAIKHVLEEHNQILIQPEAIHNLYLLNDALSECRIFELECKQLNHKLLLFNPFTYYFIRRMKKQLRGIKDYLESVSAAPERSGNRFDLQEKSQSVVSSGIYGFYEQAEHIEGLLFKTGIRFTAISIVGIAGVGKTTLVQRVLERKRVVDGFKSIFWLSFSGLKEERKLYDRLSIETCIVDNLGNTVEEKIVGLGELLEKLNQHLSGVRYLLVLDDMWGQHIDIGKRLQRGLPKGSGGAVIFTTMLNEVAEKLVDQDKVIHGKPLDGEKSQSVVSSCIYGFDEQAEHIEGLLFKTGIRFTAISIVGIAGVGKTTLVQRVLERKRVVDGFKSIFWLSFSGMEEERKQYDRLSIETCIVDNLGNTVERKIVGLGELWEKLNQHLSGVRYLLVLDDMWGQHIDIGKRLQRGLPKGSGDAVIFTTRLNEVAEKLVHQDKVIHVKPLDGESCWNIFSETMKNNGEILWKSQVNTLEKIKGEIKEQCHGLPLVAKALAKIIPEQIREIESERFLKELYIPDEFLRTDLDAEPVLYIPNIPVLVFIDMKNDQLGAKLLIEFSYHLNKAQVHAVPGNWNSKQRGQEKNPEEVLNGFYATLEKLKQKKYSFASKIEKEMRIIIVGGDAVVNRILGVICDLKLPEAPYIVPIPQGAENDIPVAENDIPATFGWKPLKADRQSVTTFLKEKVTVAENLKTDSWHVLIKMKSTPSSTDQQELPPSLHVPEGVTQTTDNLTLCGGVWNYFSLGVDAPRSYAPYCLHPNARTLNSLVKVRIMENGTWVSLNIPSRIKSIICLNLPVYHGEANPWGTPNMKKDRKKRMSSAFINDAHLEIIGLADILFAQNERIRLGQVRGIRFEIIKDAAESVNLIIDGAPWKKVPLDRIIDITVSYNGQVNILSNGDCAAKSSSQHSSLPCASGVVDDRASKSADETNAKDNPQAYNKKFTTTRTFNIS